MQSRLSFCLTDAVAPCFPGRHRLLWCILFWPLSIHQVSCSRSPRFQATAAERTVALVSSLRYLPHRPEDQTGTILITLSKRVLLCSAAEALASQVTNEDRAVGLVYPPFTRIRKISAVIATAVAERSYELGELLAICIPEVSIRAVAE
jgi:hypothetical protein